MADRLDRAAELVAARASGGVHRRGCLDRVRHPRLPESHRPLGAVRPGGLLLPELHALRRGARPLLGGRPGALRRHSRGAAESGAPGARRRWTAWGSSTASSRRTSTTSTSAPGWIPTRSSSSTATRPGCDASRATAAASRDEIQERLLAGEIVPPCQTCGGILKPLTVLFGEPMPSGAVERAEARARGAGCFLVVGSSLAVYPAAYIPTYADGSGRAPGRDQPHTDPAGPRRRRGAGRVRRARCSRDWSNEWRPGRFAERGAREPTGAEPRQGQKEGSRAEESGWRDRRGGRGSRGDGRGPDRGTVGGAPGGRKHHSGHGTVDGAHVAGAR